MNFTISGKNCEEMLSFPGGNVIILLRKLFSNPTRRRLMGRSQTNYQHINSN